MSGERVYPPAVWWLPKRVRDALQYEAGMQGIAAQPVGDEPPPECATEEEQPTGIRPQPLGPARRLPPEASTMPGQIFPPMPETPLADGLRVLGASQEAIDEYHRQATSGDSGGYWCRINDCFHRAPAQGDVCPVHRDMGWKAIDLGGDAA